MSNKCNIIFYEIVDKVFPNFILLIYYENLLDDFAYLHLPVSRNAGHIILLSVIIPIRYLL